MKKLLFILMAIMPLSFIGCSSDDNDNENKGKSNSKIVGVWSETDYWDDGAISGKPNTWHTWGFVSHPFHEFKADNTYRKYESVDDYEAGKVYNSGTYTFDGEYLSINGGFKRKITFSEAGNQFEWEKTAICARYK